MTAAPLDLIPGASSDAAFVASWGMQAMVIGAVLAGAATLLQRIARDAVPVRAIWAGALLLSTALVASAPWRLRPVPVMPAAGPPTAADAAMTPVPAEGASGSLRDRVLSWLDRPVHLAAESAAPLGARAGRLLLAGWALASGALVLLLVLGHRRLRRLVRAAEVREVAGVPVHLTADIGPAVVGVRAPMIVAPRWLLERAEPEQALIVRHERAHIAAGDPLLLAGGVLLAALQPWNPTAWLMVRRLRLAIELDCDRRLLRAGTPTRAYGDLLISLAGAATPRLVAPAIHPMFTHHRSHLARRILAMTDRPVRHLLPRRALVVALALAAAATACESRLPTSAEVEAMDAAMVERRVEGFVAVPDNVTYYVDGVRTTPEAAKALPADRIASVEVAKGGSADPRIFITTGTPTGTLTERRLVEGMPLDSSAGALFIVRRDSSAAVPPAGALIRRSAAEVAAAPAGAKPIVIVDGVRADDAALRAISPDRIASITVHKGEAAKKLYGAEGANGVIVVVTKR